MAMVEELKVQKDEYFGSMKFYILRIDGTISPLDNDLDVLRLGNFVKDGEVEVFVEAKVPLNVVLPPSSRSNTPTKRTCDEIEIDSCSDSDSGSPVVKVCMKHTLMMIVLKMI